MNFRNLQLVAIWILLVPPAAGASGRDAPDATGPSAYGQRGLLRTWSSDACAPGGLVTGLSMGFFSAGDFLAEGDEHQRLSSRLTLSLVPMKGLQINSGLSMSVNRNRAFDPQESRSAGDLFLGARYGLAMTEWFSLGAGVQSLFPTGSESFELSHEGISTKIVATFDFKPVLEALLTINVGYHFDNSSRIFKGDLNEAQRFSAGINPHDQLLLYLGAAYDFGRLAPFLEYGTAQALGADGMGFGDSPNWLTVGLRAWPLSQRTLCLMLAADVGLSADYGAKAGKARIPPYNLIVGVSYDFGARTPPPPRVEIREVVRVEKVEVPVPAPAPAPRGRIAGRVLDSHTKKPLGDARIVLEGCSPSILLSDPKEGRFFSCPSDPGPVKLTVSREGYADRTQVVLVTDRPETAVTIELRSSKAIEFGVLRGTVRSVTGKPLPALISVPTHGIKTRARKASGKFEIRLPTGVIDVMISMPGHLTQRRKIKLASEDEVVINVELYPSK